MRLYEHWNISDPALANLYAHFWQGQTFTPRETHTIRLLKLSLYRYGRPGPITISIRETNGNHLPHGPDLIQATIDGDALPTIYTQARADVPLPDGLTALQHTPYAIIARAPHGNNDNYVRWRFQRPSSYPRGTHIFSSDSGVTWECDPTRDLRFEEWGD